MKSLAFSALVFLLLPVTVAAQSDSSKAAIAPLPEYDLSVQLVPDAHRMEVKGTLRFTTGDKPVPSVDLSLIDQMKNFQAEIIEPKEIAGRVEAVQEDKKNSAQRFVSWTLRPKKPFGANQSVRIRFSYGGGEQLTFLFYLGPEGSFASGNWYPRLVGADGKGIGRIAYSVPAGLTVMASGKRLSNRAEEGKGNFVFEQKTPSFFSFAAGKYTVLERAGIVPMRAYLLHERANAESYLDGASKVLALLSKEFGPYPYDEFAIAEVPSDQALKAGFIGASLPGFMLANKEGLDEPFSLPYYGHEIGHQWWGNLVSASGNRGAQMMSEGLAQFGSLRTVEIVEGALAAEIYRRGSYPRWSPPQSGYGFMRATGVIPEVTLSGMGSGIGHYVADAKGFLAWDLLSRTIGRERFSQALHNVTSKYAFRHISWEDFLVEIQAASGQDLAWFYSQWFERSGIPDWQLTWKQDSGAVTGNLSQSEPYYQAQLEVEIQGVDGESVTKLVEAKGATTELSWPMNFPVRSVVLDPHFLVLHWVPEMHAMVSAREPFVRAAGLRNSGKLDEAESLLRKALESLPETDYSVARFFDQYGLARVAIARKAWRDAQSLLDATLISPARDPLTLPSVYYWHAVVAKELHDDSKLRWAVNMTINADALVPGGAGPDLLDLNETSAVRLARALLPAVPAN